MLMEQEVLSLIDEYNLGNISFAELILASGWEIVPLCKFMREKGIEIHFNMGFMDNGKGLNEEALEQILEMI